MEITTEIEHSKSKPKTSKWRSPLAQSSIQLVVEWYDQTFLVKPFTFVATTQLSNTLQFILLLLLAFKLTN